MPATSADTSALAGEFQAQYASWGGRGQICDLVPRVLRGMSLFPDHPVCTVAVIGLGYVGLPLAVEFAKSQPCRLTGSPLRRRDWF